MAKPSPKHSGNTTLVSIGTTIRAIRQEKKLSQESLAHNAEIDRSYMGGIERGEHNPTVINLLKITEQLEIKMSELFVRAGL